MDVLEAIFTRRSIRRFEPRPVPDDLLRKVLEAGIWAPSGMNNQPWRFVVIKDAKAKEDLSKLTHYSHIVKGAAVLVALFLDHRASYDYVKDVQACGACLENMLLAAHALGLGGVWIGEILKAKDRVRELLGVPDACELMAVVALGYPAERPTGTRRPLDSFILKVI